MPNRLTYISINKILLGFYIVLVAAALAFNMAMYLNIVEGGK